MSIVSVGAWMRNESWQLLTPCNIIWQLPKGAVAAKVTDDMAENIGGLYVMLRALVTADWPEDRDYLQNRTTLVIPYRVGSGTTFTLFYTS